MGSVGVHAYYVYDNRRCKEKIKREQTYVYCSSHPSIQRGRRALRTGCSCNDRNCRPSACTGFHNPSHSSAPRKSPYIRTPSSRVRFCIRPRSNSARRPATFASSAWLSILFLQMKKIVCVKILWYFLLSLLFLRTGKCKFFHRVNDY